MVTLPVSLSVRSGSREFKTPRRRRPRTESRLKGELFSFKLYRDRSHFANFAKCKRTILKPNSLHSYPSSEREEKFVVARLSPPKKVKLGIFTSQSCSDDEEMLKKACCKCRVVVLPIQPIAFFLPFSLPSSLPLWHL